MMRIDPNSKEAILAKKLDSYIFRQKQEIFHRDHSEQHLITQNFLWSLELIYSALIHGTIQRLHALYMLTILDIEFAKTELVKDFPDIAQKVSEQSVKLSRDIENLLLP